MTTFVMLRFSALFSDELQIVPLEEASYITGRNSILRCTRTKLAQRNGAVCRRRQWRVRWRQPRSVSSLREERNEHLHRLVTEGAGRRVDIIIIHDQYISNVLNPFMKYI